jgi:hypothetical protein
MGQSVILREEQILRTKERADYLGLRTRKYQNNGKIT